MQHFFWVSASLRRQKTSKNGASGTFKPPKEHLSLPHLLRWLSSSYATSGISVAPAAKNFSTFFPLSHIFTRSNSLYFKLNTRKISESGLAADAFRMAIRRLPKNSFKARKIANKNSLIQHLSAKKLTKNQKNRINNWI